MNKTYPNEFPSLNSGRLAEQKLKNRLRIIKSVPLCPLWIATC